MSREIELQAAKLLANSGIKPTANRLLVLKTLLRASAPMSLVECETELQTLERSSIFRVLTLFVERCIVHSIEDGRGITKYEVCHCEGHHDHDDDDLHAHFYCERCQRVFCFEDISIPRMPLPAGFEPRSVNFMIKGLCPDCAKD